MANKRTIDIMMIGLRSVNGAQGGVERHVRSLVEEFDAMGLATCIVERSPYSRGGRAAFGAHGQIMPIWSPRSASYEALAHSVLATLWAGLVRPRVLHVHAIGPSIVAPLARLLGLHVVCTHHGRDYDRQKWGTFAKLVLRLGEWCQAHFAQGRICVAQSLSLQLKAELGVPFTYIPNAVKLPPLSGDPTILDQLQLQPGKYVINLGRLVPEKRQDDLIRAFSRLARKDVKLVLVGSADHPSQYSEDLAKLADAVPGVIMAGFRQGSDLVQLLANAALFALPSSHEGMPIAALEAMSLSRPVLLSDIPANMDLMLPPECYHKTASVEDLAEKLEHRLAAQSDAGVPAVDWTEVLSAYNWRTVARQTLDVYDQASTGFSQAVKARRP
ncbi:glycosyltransferase family 4 protein [Devosia nitrariae]|uniref:Glycosyl transferase n=1 Tax=Devosia nitrariae TaxID=2071872 RepID=A0ABQ5WCS0_9HYPH|nr:glycosyltransferase family 4 protein [Devosia nitrariae]GLQ57932.1 glycosyl transferase [Devosia nitrariae]